MSTALAVCIGYLALALVLGLTPGLKASRSVTGFVAGDHAMGVVLMYFVMGATIFSSAAFLGVPGWAYSRGGAAYFLLTYVAFGMLPFYFLGPRARRAGAAFGIVTQAGLIGHRFQDRRLTTLLAIVSVVAFIPYIALQMKGAGYIVEVLSEGAIPSWIGALATYTVVVLYVTISGVMGVGWSSVLQGAVMMVVAWALGLYVPYALYGGIGEMFDAIAASDAAAMMPPPGLSGSGEPWTWLEYGSAMLVTGLGFSCWPHLFMKAFAAKDDRAIRLPLVLYPTFQLFLVPILFLGFAGILALPELQAADTVVPELMLLTELSPWLVGLACAGVLAASMSSGDAILHAAGSILVRDGYGSVRETRLPDLTERRAMQAATIVVAIVGFMMAVSSDLSLVGMLVLAYGAVVQILPGIVAALYWPRATASGVLAGLIGGVGVTGLFLFMPELKPIAMHEGAYGLLVNIILMVTVSKGTAPAAREHLDAYRRPALRDGYRPALRDGYRPALRAGYRC
jgi:SSS family solute:Na+ symporter